MLIMVLRIIPESAHVAFDKAAHYFKIKLHKIPVDVVTRQVDTAWVKHAMLVISIHSDFTYLLSEQFR